MVISSLMAPVFSLINGPIFSIIDKLVPDAALKEKLKAQISSQTIKAQSDFEEAQKQLVLQEIARGSTFTKSWRPVLMYLIMLLLVVYGLVLPFIDLFAEIPINFKPRWGDIPDGLWNLLSLGVGGYIGGRSAEKIATSLSSLKGRKPQKSAKKWYRKNNLHRNG